MPSKLIGLGILSAIAVIAAIFPTEYVHRSLSASEDPKYIRRVYAEHSVGQTFHAKYPVDTIRILVRGYHPASIMLHSAVAGQTQAIPIALTEQDQWVDIPLEPSLPPGQYDLTLTAPELQDQSDALLIRFQVASTFFEPGSMVVDGQPSYGDIALQFVDRIPAGLQIVRYFEHRPNHLTATIRAVLIASVLTLTLIALPRNRTVWRWMLIALFAFTVAIRIPTLARIDGVFGGDAFNYLSKAKAWMEGDDPFNADPRKGPFVPLVLMPVLLLDDPIAWSRFTGALAAGVAVVATALTARALGIGPRLALTAGLLAAVNRELWWESLNGLANVPYAALIALSTYSFVRRAPFHTALYSTLATLTRYEGLLVVAIYVPAVWLRHRLRLSTLRPLLTPLLLLAVPLVFWPLTGGLGIRTADDIASDTGLYIAWDWGDYVSNLKRFQAYLEQLWFFDLSAPLSHFNQAIHITAIIGAAILVIRRPKIGIPIVLVALAQIAAVTAILPKTRYYVQLVPLFTVATIYGLSILPRKISLPLATLLVSGVALNTYARLPELYEDYNARAHHDSVMMQVATYFRRHEGRPAFATNFLAAETYLPRSGSVMGAPETVEAQIEWLRNNHATHLVETDQLPWFQSLLQAFPEKFEYVTAFKASYDPTTATIYRIQDL